VTTIEQAYDELAGIINTAWLAGAATSGLTLLWDDVVGDKPTTESDGQVAAYGRCYIRHTAGGQDTLAARGRRRFVSSGILTVQIFTPFGQGYRLANQIGKVVRDAILATSPTSPINFSDPAYREFGRDGNTPWTMSTVSATFRYYDRA
jgi:hypothetical protein